MKQLIYDMANTVTVKVTKKIMDKIQVTILQSMLKIRAKIFHKKSI